MDLPCLLRPKNKQPLSKFLGKAIPLLAFLLAVGAYGFDRYRFGIETQEDPCLPGARVYLIDTYNTEPERGGVFAFGSRWMAPFYEDGTTIIKVMDGLPGDTAVVSEEKTTINGEVVAEGLTLKTKINRPESEFIRTRIIPQGSYWFSGKTDISFDSRYWGYVKQEQLIGRAYPLYALTHFIEFFEKS